MAVGIEAPAFDEEDEPEDEPLVADAEPPDVLAPPAVEVPSEACEMTELFWLWMLARMDDCPALTAVELPVAVWIAVAFGAAVMLAAALLSAAGFVASGTR